MLPNRSNLSPEVLQQVMQVRAQQEIMRAHDLPECPKEKYPLLQLAMYGRLKNPELNRKMEFHYYTQNMKALEKLVPNPGTGVKHAEKKMAQKQNTAKTRCQVQVDFEKSRGEVQVQNTESDSAPD